MTLRLLVIGLSCFGMARLGLGSNAVALYHLDEAEGVTTYRDSSFSGNDGTCSGGTCPTNVTFGKFNSAALFDGDDEITIPDNSNLDNTSAITIQAWFFPTSLTGDPRGIVSKRTDAANNQSYALYVHTGNQLFVDIDKQTTNNRFSISNVARVNRWHHVAVVYDGSLAAANRVNVYFNGALDGSSPHVEGSASIPDFGSPLYIGALNAGYGQDFIGIIDEVSIYNSALRARDIREHYLRGHWRYYRQLQKCGGTVCNIADEFFLPSAARYLIPGFETVGWE